MSLPSVLVLGGETSKGGRSVLEGRGKGCVKGKALASNSEAYRRAPPRGKEELDRCLTEKKLAVEDGQWAPFTLRTAVLIAAAS